MAGLDIIKKNSRGCTWLLSNAANPASLRHLPSTGNEGCNVKIETFHKVSLAVKSASNFVPIIYPPFADNIAVLYIYKEAAASFYHFIPTAASFSFFGGFE